jgi:hypothetical protein
MRSEMKFQETTAVFNPAFRIYPRSGFRSRLGILPVVGTDGSRRKKDLGRFRTHDSPEGDFYSSNVESESAEATGGARLGSPMHSRIFRVLIGG